MNDFLAYEEVYSTLQRQLITDEFRRLEGYCYLDHASTTLYSEKQIQNTLSDLSSNIYANPHSMNVSGKSTEDAIDIVRYCILEHFNTNCEEYSVIFTSGATGALKVIAECFDYGEETKGNFAFLENNHTSVLGMRSFAENCTEIKIADAFYAFENFESNGSFENNNSLFVYPSQSNFSGTKFPLNWIDKVKRGHLNSLVDVRSKNWYVAVDCASYVSTNQLDLSKYKPDFVPISFYKMFGYPTGLGALLVKKSSEQLLKKKYYGGGTVLMALSSTNVMIPRPSIQERFEDGTLPFLSIIAVKHGFDTIRRLNLNYDLISRNVFTLGRYVFRNLLTLHHSNGQPAVILHHDTTFESRRDQGGIVNFSLVRPNGEHIGYSEVLHMANLHRIHLRTGCFCNPGACKSFLKLQDSDVVKHFEAGHVCGDQHDLIDGYPTGTIRISFGYMSKKEDADSFLKMIEECFVESPIVRKLSRSWTSLQENYRTTFKPNVISDHKTYIQNYTETNGIRDKCSSSRCSEEEEKQECGMLQQILLYPIKSCGAFAAPKRWQLTSKGLKYDREWMIVNCLGVCMTQKQNKKLCLINPTIDLETNIMTLTFKGRSITMDLDNLSDTRKAYLCQSKICQERVQGWDCGDEISDWLSECLEMPGLRLLRQCDETDNLTEDAVSDMSYANKAQFLLINSTSVSWLVDKIPKNDLDEDLNSVIQRFRPNLVVKLGRPFQENEFDEFLFDGLRFKSAGKCTRCQMICINQKSGETSKEPLLTLSREFKGKISFGVYLNFLLNGKCYLEIGSRLKF